jgi:TolB-like protein
MLWEGFWMSVMLITAMGSIITWLNKRRECIMRGVWIGITVMSLLWSATFVQAQEGKIIFEEKFDGKLSGWKVMAGGWSNDERIRSFGGGLNLMLLNKPIKGDWILKVHFSLYSYPLPEILLWWQDPDNWLKFIIDASKGTFSFREMRNGNEFQPATKSAKLGALIRVDIIKQGTKFTAIVDTEYRLTYDSKITTSKEGFIGLRGEGGTGYITFFQLMEMPGSVVTPPSPETSSKEAPSPSESAPFVVDPNDLDKLASQLAENCANHPVAKEIMKKGNIAIATFDLIDISSPSVAKNAIEDLSTSMINKGFQLVERGQLDKVIKELKIQSSGAIDPKTAQEIGKLTGADLILVGSISDRGNFVVINARLLETKTGKAIVASRVEMRKIPIKRD